MDPLSQDEATEFLHKYIDQGIPSTQVRQKLLDAGYDAKLVDRVMQSDVSTSIKAPNLTSNENAAQGQIRLQNEAFKKRRLSTLGKLSIGIGGILSLIFGFFPWRNVSCSTVIINVNTVCTGRGVGFPLIEREIDTLHTGAVTTTVGFFNSTGIGGLNLMLWIAGIFIVGWIIRALLRLGR